LALIDISCTNVTSMTADSILPRNDDHAKLRQYLQTISNNVNQIVAKMVWNAHSRTVNLLANDRKENAHFWDIHTFNKSLFDSFYPEDPLPVVHQMHESWHRAFNPPPMVRYTAKDYPIGKHCSPFEEIDEVAETLFRDNNKTLYTGRVVKPPSRRNKGRAALGAALRPDGRLATRSNWLHDLTGLPNASLEPKHCDDGSVSCTLARKPGLMQDVKNDTKQNDSTHSTICSNDRLELNQTPEQPSRLEMLVHTYGPDVLVKDQALTSQDKEVDSQKARTVFWRNRLIEDHKRRLAERWPRFRKRTQTPAHNIKVVIEQAVTRGLLKHPNAEVYKRLDLAARIEERKLLRAAIQQNEPPETACNAPTGAQHPSQECLNPKKLMQSRTSEVVPKTKSFGPPTKKRKLASKACSVIAHPVEPVVLPPHPSGSKTLEPHQRLPPEAYFERASDEEQPVWRCGIRHALGYYYNAGDRKNCVGCFTSVHHNPRLKWMDFYLPPKSHFHQAAPGIIWNPSKHYAKTRRSKHLSHNSIAKEAFWDAINTGANADVARRKAVEAIEAYLRPKTPPREPTPEIEPEPVDLGPHPSGSSTMEHGQDLPQCAYWEKKERGEEFAWRCDVNHALGRYYLSGNRRSCPGCGSNKVGSAKHAEMDFYLPDGVIVRQEAPGLPKWRPRKPYKITPRTGKPSTHKGKQVMTHNQICSKKYWEAVEAGQEHSEALASAIARTDTVLDARNEEIRIKQQELQVELEASQRLTKVSKAKVASASKGEEDDAAVAQGIVVSLVPRKRSRHQLSQGKRQMDEQYDSGRVTLESAVEDNPYSSNDESTSSSDSE
jgi:hypothetical protein